MFSAGCTMNIGSKKLLREVASIFCGAHRAEDGIAVAQQVARQLVEGKGLSQLLPRPLRGRVRGHVAVQNAPSVMGQNQKHIENLETYGRHSEEVDRDQLLGVILQERAPGLRRRLATAHHVFADAGLADVDAQLEQLPVNPGCTPPRIIPAHPADQIANLARNDRPSGVAAAHLPGPEPAKASTMPGPDRFWLDDGQSRAPVAPQAGQPDP